MSRSADQILTAALAVFSRYGYKRTTMNDIASEAGVARQTLYNAYDGKEAVMRAGVRHIATKTFATLETGLAERTDLGDQVDFFFETGPIAWFDMVRSSPEMADLLEGMGQVARAEVLEFDEEWRRVCTGMLEPYRTSIEAHGTTPELAARFIYGAATAAKKDVLTREDFIGRLGAAKAMILALCGVQAA